MGIVTLSTGMAQTYDQIIKLREEYEQLKEAQKIQATSDPSMLQSESTGPTRVLYKPADLDEFYRIQLSQLIQSMEEINQISAYFKLSSGFSHYGYDIFTNKDTISYYENMPLSDNYSLGAGDELIVSLWGEVEREEKTVINRDGNVFLEDVGLIHLGGKKLSESKIIIVKKYEQTYSTLKRPNPKTFLNVSLGNLKGVNIQILGFVKNPGVYALHPFSDPFSAIFQAGGIDTTGTLRRIELYRSGEKINEVDFYDIIHRGKKNTSIRLLDQDIIFVPPRKSKILLNGEVIKPGYYELLKDETVANIIEYSGGNLPHASGTAMIKRVHTNNNRENDDGAIEFLSINANAFSNFVLSNGDSIGIPKVSDFYPTVALNGQVKRPGVYPYINGQSLKEILDIGGGLQDEVWRNSIEPDIELKRTASNGNRQSLQFHLDDIMANTNNTLLEPFDEIIIYRNANYPRGEMVHISGEVKAPGDYAINGQSIRQLIDGAGGLTVLGFNDGINMIRDTLKIGINTLNIIPIAGDSIYIPQRSGTVEVLGAVNNPGLITYESGEDLNTFIEIAGGFTVYANKKDIFVIYPNGTAKRKTRFSTPKVTEGAVIMVSANQLVVQQVDYLEVSQQVASIIGSLATVALIINTQR